MERFPLKLVPFVAHTGVSKMSTPNGFGHMDRIGQQIIDQPLRRSRLMRESIVALNPAIQHMVRLTDERRFRFAGALLPEPEARRLRGGGSWILGEL